MCVGMSIFQCATEIYYQQLSFTSDLRIDTCSAIVQMKRSCSWHPSNLSGGLPQQWLPLMSEMRESWHTAALLPGRHAFVHVRENRWEFIPSCSDSMIFYIMIFYITRAIYITCFRSKCYGIIMASCQNLKTM